jgi:hypothetical protein
MLAGGEPERRRPSSPERQRHAANDRGPAKSDAGDLTVLEILVDRRTAGAWPPAGNCKALEQPIV